MKNYKGNMLLIELVIVILFFALSQVVIVQVFADAQRRTNETTRLNQALTQAEDFVEQLSGQAQPEEALQAMGFIPQEEGYRYEGVDGVALTAQVHRLSQPRGELITVDILAHSGETELFWLPAVQYIATEVEP